MRVDRTSVARNRNSWVRSMKLTLWVVIVIALFFGGGFAFLSTWDIPAPTSQIEQVLPNDQFPR